MEKDTSKIERQFINLLLHHRVMVESWLNSKLGLHFFNPEHHFILKSISLCYDKNVLLTRKTFLSMLNDFSAPKDRVEQTNLFVKCHSMEKANVDDFPTLLKSIHDNYIFNQVKSGFEKYNKDRQKKDNRYAFKELMDKFSEIEVDPESSDKVVFADINDISAPYIQEIKDIQSGKIVKKKKVLCGIKEIDETMVTGFQPGTFTLFCADIGGFKSCIMLNVGLNIWKRGHNVLFVPIEMDKGQIWKRALARESGIFTEKLFNEETLTTQEVETCEKVVEEWKTHQSRFYIMQLAGMTTVSAIKRQVEKHIDIFQPEVVIIDYMDNLEADRKFNDRKDLEIHDMILNLRNIGLNRGFAVVSAAQLSRDALKKVRKTGSSKNDKEVVTFHSEDIRGAHSFAMAADNVYAQNPNSQQPTEKLDFFVIKARNGKTKFPNGTMRGELDIFPVIGLIRSQGEFDSHGDTSVYKVFSVNEEDDIISKEDKNEEIYDYEKSESSEDIGKKDSKKDTGFLEDF